MNRNAFQISLILLIACSCKSTESDTSYSESPSSAGSALVEAHAESSQQFSVTEATVAPQKVADTPTGYSRSYELGSTETTLWRDPEFRRRFTQSYIAENEIEPRVTLEERDILEDVADYIATERFDKAVDLLRKKGGPQASAVFEFTLGNIHFQNERLEEAARAYTTAVGKYPKFRRAWKNLGLVQIRIDEVAEAAAAFTRVIELGGGDAITYGLLGFAYGNLEQPLAAESAYRMAALLDPETFDWKLGLARSFFSQSRFADAATLCGALIDEQRDSADLWLLQANAFVGLGDHRKAAQNFEFVERLGKSTPSSLNNLGDIYVNDKLFDLATRAYVRSLEMSAKRDFTRVLRAARSIIANAAFDDALFLLAEVKRIQADALDPELEKQLLKLEARVAVARGQGTEEARILEQIVALDPRDGEALILLGQHNGGIGEVEKAVFYFERAQNIEGFEGDAKRRHGQLLVNAERYNEALPLLRRALALAPSASLESYVEQVERVARTATSSN